MSSFWLILKQQWAIEKKYIFSNSSHLEWRAGLSDIIVKGTLPRTIPARFGLIWFRGFRGEDLNMKGYNVRRTDGQWRMPSDGKSSHGLWPGELKIGSSSIISTYPLTSNDRWLSCKIWFIKQCVIIIIWI
jgi:hypothetical protein